MSLLLALQSPAEINISAAMLESSDSASDVANVTDAVVNISGGIKPFLPYIAEPISADTTWDVIGLGGIQSRAYVSPVTITIYPRDKKKRREEELLLLAA